MDEDFYKTRYKLLLIKYSKILSIIKRGHFEQKILEVDWELLDGAMRESWEPLKDYIHDPSGKDLRFVIDPLSLKEWQELIEDKKTDISL